VLGLERQRLSASLAMRRRSCVTTSSISRTRRGSKRWPPETSVAVALASCSGVKLL
jgi:hypothetical protein